MPFIVLVDDLDADKWIDHALADTDKLVDLMSPFPEAQVATPVTAFVNSVRNQGPQCVEPII